MTRLTRKSTNEDYKIYKDEAIEDNKWSNYKIPIKSKEQFFKEQPYQWNSEARTTNAVIQKLAMLEDLEEELGCPLDVLFKALKKEYKEEKEILEAFKRRLVEKTNGEVVISTYSGTLEDFEDVKKDLKLINDWWVKNQRR